MILIIVFMQGLFLSPGLQAKRQINYQTPVIIPDSSAENIAKDDIGEYLDSANMASYFFNEPVRKYVYQSFIDFYKKRDYQLAWHSLEKPLPQSDSLMAALENAPNEGLIYDHQLAKLQEKRKRVFSPQTNTVVSESQQKERIANLDFLITASYLTYASHLLSGKVDPDQFDVTWLAVPRKRNLAPLLQQAITDNQISNSLDKIKPSHPQYNALKKALARYQAILTKGGWQSLPYQTTLHVGDSSELVRGLRKRLQIEMGQQENLTDGPQEDTFDESLNKAVKQFQRINGLYADGIVGKQTLNKLNISVEDRIKTIKINLERIRWLPDTMGESYVQVNIPQYYLYVIEQGGVVMDMKVIVGKDYHSTPIFSDTIQYIEFSPTWTVPQSIASKEILPKLQKDSTYLSRNHFDLYESWDSNAAKVDPLQIDWDELSEETFSYRLVQQPGPENPLGQIKFMFPNKLAIYLHDTPNERLFDRKVRAFSHGCVRVDKPIDLAVYLLKSLDGWDDQQVKEQMHLPQPKAVSLPEPIPVVFVYQTAFVDAEGFLQFRADIYGHDQMQIKAIQ